MSDWPPLTIRPLTKPGTTLDHARKYSPFRVRGGGKTPLRQTLSLLDAELWHLNASNTVLEMDVTESDLRLDGRPRANARTASPAVALSFDTAKGRLRFATDLFTDWQDNLRAIALGLEALRKVDRYGITHAGEQYAGWKAIENTAEKPRAVLERHAFLEVPTAGMSNRELYREAIKRVHPDNPETGNAFAFGEVQDVRRQLEQGGEW